MSHYSLRLTISRRITLHTRCSTTYFTTEYTDISVDLKYQLKIKLIPIFRSVPSLSWNIEKRIAAKRLASAGGGGGGGLLHTNLRMYSWQTLHFLLLRAARITHNTCPHSRRVSRNLNVHTWNITLILSRWRVRKSLRSRWISLCRHRAFQASPTSLTLYRPPFSLPLPRSATYLPHPIPRSHDRGGGWASYFSFKKIEPDVEGGEKRKSRQRQREATRKKRKKPSRDR